MAGTAPAEPYEPDPVDVADLSRWLVFIDHIPDGLVDPVYGITDERAYEQFIGGWQEDIQTAIAGSGSFPLGTSVEHRGYQIGAAAGPYWDLIFFLKDHGNEVVQTVVPYLDVAKYLLDVIQLRRRRLIGSGKSEEEVDHLLGRTALTAYMVESLCLSHAHTHYYDPSKHPALRKVVHTHESDEGTIDRPSPQTRYTVSVGVGKTTYVYHCFANGRVDSLLCIEDGNTTVKTVPTLTESANMISGA